MTKSRLFCLMVKDNYFGWKKLLSTLQARQFIESLDDYTPVSVMTNARHAFNTGLNLEEVMCVVNPDYTEHQRNILISSIKKGINVECVKTFAHPNITSEQMECFQYAFVSGVPLDVVNKYFKPDGKIVFDTSQMNVIVDFIKDGWSDALKHIANPIYSGEKLRAIYDAQKEQNRTLYFINIEYLLKFNSEQIPEVVRGIKTLYPKDTELFKSWIDENTTPDQISFAVNYISSIFTRTLLMKKSDIKKELFPEDKFSEEQKDFIVDSIWDGLKPKKAVLLADSRYTVPQMQLVKEVIQSNLPKEQIALICNPRLSYEEMLKVLLSVTEYNFNQKNN